MADGTIDVDEILLVRRWVQTDRRASRPVAGESSLGNREAGDVAVLPVRVVRATTRSQRGDPM